jgi:hypothetical protein
MPIGNVNNVPNNLYDFKLDNSNKLLGMEISNSLTNTDEIFVEIGEKILNIILFWSRCRLSPCVVGSQFSKH